MNSPALLLPGWAQNVSRETFSHLSAYVALLQKWNARINLIGKSTEAEIWQRHIADGLQLLPLIPDPIQTLADLGSGAGLPGLVIAIGRPALAVTLIEQDQRKAAFLREAAASLDLRNVRVLNTDLHAVHEKFDLVTARALASLSELCTMAHPFCGKETICLFPKGRNFAMELEEALAHWRMEYQTIPSKTQEDASIISLSELMPAS